MPESFYDELAARPRSRVRDRLYATRERDVEAALETAQAGEALSPEQYLALLSPVAESRLERMAVLAHEITLRRFGRTVQLFTPLYLSNFCTNRCVYCGFNTGNTIERRKLGPEEIEAEGAAVAATGLRHILLLTGEAPQIAGPAYLADAVRRLRRYFPGIAVEVYALTEEEYALLVAAGTDGMTLFQETYNESLYATLHPAGPKQDFRFRLDAPDRAGKAGMRSLNVGALLGLDDWRTDGFYTGLHARFLQRRRPSAEIALSVPRMRPHAGSFADVHPVSDRNLVQLITAARLFLPDAGITVSSRERAVFRDRLIRLGVTRVSAGVSTAVGGHASPPPLGSATTEFAASTPQFEIADTRSVREMAEAVIRQGYRPEFKYWEPLDGASYACGAPNRAGAEA